MKIVYVHQITKNEHNNFFPSGTIGLKIPAKDYLETVLKTHSNNLIIEIGTTLLSDKDRYEKKVGRTLVEERVLPQKLELSHVEIRGTRHIYHLSGTIPSKGHKGGSFVNVGLSTIAENNTVRLMYANFTNA